MKAKVLGILLALFTLAGCIKEDLDPCPVGNVKINVYAEKFQNPSEEPMASTESDFKGRISHLRYFLYKGKELKEEGIVTDFSRVNGAFYTFDRFGLDFGDYTLVLVGNSTQTALSGNPSKMDNLLITYPGPDLTKDYFSAVFPFTVDCDCTTEFNVGMSRMHGVVRYIFENMPEDVTAIEVTMKNVGVKKWIHGDYAEKTDIVKTYVPATLQSRAAKQQWVMGTFPTAAGEKSVYSVKVYRQHSSLPFYEGVVSEQLEVKRNQLLDIKAVFNDGTLRFDISIDHTWDGTSDGGDTEIE